MSLIKELRVSSEDDLENYLRMSDECFRVLLHLIHNSFKKILYVYFTEDQHRLECVEINLLHSRTAQPFMYLETSASQWPAIHSMHQ
jgi:hypothetical protein